MRLNNKRVGLPGLSVVVSFLLSGCFATEPTKAGITKIEKVVLPGVQRLVHNNPFVKDRVAKEPDGDVPTHVVNLRQRPTPANFRLLRPGHGAVCADSVSDTYFASFSALISVDRRRASAQLMAIPATKAKQ